VVIIAAVALVVLLSVGFATTQAGRADGSDLSEQSLMLQEAIGTTNEQTKNIEQMLSEATIISVTISNNPILLGMDTHWIAYDLICDVGTYVLILRKEDCDFTAILESDGKLLWGMIDQGVTPALFNDDGYIFNNRRVYAKRGQEIADSFGVNTEGYTCIINTELSNYIESLEDVLFIKHSLNLSFGDHIPVYFLSSDENTLLAVKQDSSGMNYLFSFEQDTHGGWRVSEDVLVAQSDILYISEEITRYQVNESGQTYGDAMMALSIETLPDLIYAGSVNGVKGYVYAKDVLDTLPKTEEEARAIVKKALSYNLYAEDGVTVIGSTGYNGVPLPEAVRKKYFAPIYPVNEKGQTYGIDGLAGPYASPPDLIAVVGIDGTEGYIYNSLQDAHGGHPPPQNPEEATEYMRWLEERKEEMRRNGEEYILIVPLYAADGVTVIGEFGYSG